MHVVKNTKHSIYPSRIKPKDIYKKETLSTLSKLTID